MSSRKPNVARSSEIATIDSAEAERLAADLARALIELLRDLEPPEWKTPTDCELWSVHDQVAHLVGWNEALISFRELLGQFRTAMSRTKELGNIIDAQNQVQVDARREMPPDQLLTRYEETYDLAARKRRRLASILGPIRVYSSYMGGWIKVSYVTNQIFLRDTLVHRIDIARATGRELRLAEPERRVIEDMVRDWFERTQAKATLVLEGPAGGTYLGDADPIATLTVDAIEFVRVLFGRAEKSIVQRSGDGAEAERALSVFFPV